MPKKQKRLTELVRFRSSDKDRHERWSDDKALLSFPRPVRICISGPCGVGKSSVIKSLMCCADPLFSKGWIMHPDEDVCETGEFQDCGLPYLPELPDTKFWYEGNASKDNHLLVIDDIALDELDGKQRRLLDRLVSNVSTHAQLSIFITAQVFFSIPTIVRRTTDVFVFFRPINLVMDAKSMSKRVGLSPDTLIALFKDHCPTKFDSVWIDLTPDSPAKIRINGTKVLREIEE